MNLLKGSSEPSFWVKDEHVSYCSGCNSVFDSVNRRHHCRFCGHVFCNNCSMHKLVNPAFDLNGDRGCNLCFQFLNVDLKYLQSPHEFIRHTINGIQQNVEIALSIDYASLIVQVNSVNNNNSKSNNNSESSSLLTTRMKIGSSGSDDNLNLNSYQRVSDGQETTTFKNSLSGGNAGSGSSSSSGGGIFSCFGCNDQPDISINSDLCFSLIFNSETVDLQARSGERKREWLHKWGIFEKRVKSDSWKYYNNLVSSKIEQEREREQMQKQKRKEESRERAQNMREKYNLKKG